MSDHDSLALVRRAALQLLARRDHSAYELEQKLRNKGHPPALLSLLIPELLQTGLINEQRFTENFIYWRRNRGYGPQRIAMELNNRRIPAEMIAELLDITDNAWLTAIRSAWQKQFKGKQPKDRKEQAKQIRFFQYRGFYREQIQTLFDLDEE